jgi:hypothetical protein
MRTDLVHTAVDLVHTAVDLEQAANSQQPTANSQQPTANSQEFQITTSVKLVVVAMVGLLVLCLLATTTLVAVHHVQLRGMMKKLGDTGVSLQGDIGLVQDLSNAQSMRIEQLVNATIMLIEVLQGYSL